MGKHLAGPQSVTGFFGRETKEALRVWQARRGIPATGYFGPRSRKHINDRLKVPVPLTLPTRVPGWATLRTCLLGARGGSARGTVGPRQKVRAQGVAVGAPAVSILVRRPTSPAGSLGLGVLFGCMAFAFSVLGRELVSRKSRLWGVAGLLQAAAATLWSLFEAIGVAVRDKIGRSDALLDIGIPAVQALPGQGDASSGPTEAGGGKDRPADARTADGGWTRDDYNKRMELRRSNSSLRSRLAAMEADLRAVQWQARREGERASRAEALYLELKSELVAREKQIAELRTELRKRPPPRL